MPMIQLRPATCNAFNSGGHAILAARGSAYGYYPNASKSVLLVKPGVLELAQELFTDTAVQIRTDGYRHLGAFGH